MIEKSAGSITNHEKVKIRIFGVSHKYYQGLVTGLCDTINKYHPWLQAVDAGSFRGPEIVKHLMKPENKKDSIICTSASYWFRARNFAADPYTHYVIAKQATAAVGLVTLDPHIKTWADLQGRKVNLYLEGSMIRELWRIVLNFHGIYDEVDKFYLGYKDAKEALLAGRIDATYISFSLANFSLTNASL